MAASDYRSFYSKEAEGYEAKRYGSRYGKLFRWWQRDAVDRALALKTRQRRILDVATGTGQMLPSLAINGDIVIASDLTPAMLAVARSKYVECTNISYCVANAKALPYIDSGFDVVASSRFMHLFELDQQQALIVEMASVLAPGGRLIVDFYSANGRHIFAPVIWVYRVLLRKRPENDQRVSLSVARQMIEKAGLHIEMVEGLGNFLLVPFLWLPRPWLLRTMRWLGRNCVSLSEQFIIVAQKP